MTGSRNPLSVETPAAERAAAALAMVREATPTLLEVVGGFTQRDLAAPSLLPGWSRGHVVTHLARSADALVNLLTSARTGIEHPAYPSRADRDADIDDGADRLAQVQREDLVASGERFLAAAARLGERDWAAVLAHPSGRPMAAAEIPELRLFEVWTHLVDLDAGVGFAAVRPDHLGALLEVAVRGRVADAGLRLVAELPDGAQRTWTLATAAQAGSGELSGPAWAALTWLTGRGTPAELVGDTPQLGPWG